jgi:hypothetical protein
MNKYLVIVACNTNIKRAIVSAMFEGCDIGTDVWEYIEGYEYPDHITKMLYGLSQEDRIAMANAETRKEEQEIEDRIDPDALYLGGNAVIAKLIGIVKDKVLNKIEEV